MKIQPNPNITPHFKLREFDCKGSGDITPAKYHANLIRVCNLLEDIRTLFDNCPVDIISGYRSVKHNDFVYKKARLLKPNAGKFSQHLTASAADFVITAHNLADVQAVLLELFNSGVDKADVMYCKLFDIDLHESDRKTLLHNISCAMRGLGLGAHKGFIHVDVRTGRRTKWTY